MDDQEFFKALVAVAAVVVPSPQPEVQCQWCHATVTLEAQVYVPPMLTEAYLGAARYAMLVEWFDPPPAVLCAHDALVLVGQLNARQGVPAGEFPTQPIATDEAADAA